MNDTKQTLEDLYRWMSRAHFARPEDEHWAATFGAKLKEIINAPEDDVEERLADTVLRVQGLLGITTTGFVSPSVVELRIEHLKNNQLTPEVRAMADCMDMVRVELTGAGLIKPGTPPMMIADELIRNLSWVRDAMMVARSWIVKRRPSMSFSRQKTVDAYVSLLMKIDTALNAIS